MCGFWFNLIRFGLLVKVEVLVLLEVKIYDLYKCVIVFKRVIIDQ